MGPSRVRRIRLAAPLDLGATLRAAAAGGFDSTWRIDHDEAWRGQLTPDGPATLHLRVRDDRLDASAWGPGTTFALDHVPTLVGEHDDRRGFEPRAIPLVHRMDRIHAGLRCGASGAVTMTAVRTVLAQRVTGGEAIRSWNGVLRRWGSRAPGPGERMGLRVPPSPQELHRLSYAAFHPLGVERGRAETVRAVCSHAARLDAWAEMQPQNAWAEAARVLPLIRGVGPWTESVVRGSALGDPDAVVVGDLHIPHEVCHALEGTDRGSDERMLELLEPFSGHRGRAQRLVLRAPGRAPRRAPRYNPLPIARM
jgi:3-methyladenine DNA glycosylase/8-oxoguanine DNA glycosylase